jgi:hypothetical protein
VKRADLQEASGADKMWCTYHEVDSPNTADCKALQSRAQPAQRAAAARSAQTATPTRHEHATPQPTLAELQELWDAHHGPMQGFSAKVVTQTAVSRLSGHYDMLPRGHAALAHSGFTALAKKNARPCGSSADMPLGLRLKDLLSAPIQPLEGPCATPCNSTTEPIVASTSTVIVPAPKSSTKEPVAVAMPDTSMPTLSNSTKEPVGGDMLVATASPMVVPSNSIKEPVVTRSEPVTKSELTPVPEGPAILSPTDTRDLPVGLEELPLDASTRSGMTYGHSVKETQDPASTEEELAPIAMTPILAEKVVPLATPVVTHETKANVGNVYDAQYPQLAAMISKLPENYHSDRTVGFHRSPRIDNSGPLPTMLINGRVVTNLLLDSGAEAIITGRPGAAAMGITSTMIERDAIVIRTAIGELVRLDQTREPVSCTLNAGTADEVTVMANVVIVKHDMPDTLIGMSAIGPAGQPCFHKKRLKYYIDWGTPNARKAFLKCLFPINFDTAAPDAVATLIAYTGAVITTASMKSSSNLQKMMTPRSMTPLPAQPLQEVNALPDRSVRVLAMPAEPMLPIAHPAYLHIRPLDVGMVDKRTPMSDTSTGMVVVKLFPDLMATTEALLRQGVRIQKVYACEGDATSRLIDAHIRKFIGSPRSRIFWCRARFTAYGGTVPQYSTLNRRVDRTRSRSLRR